MNGMLAILGVCLIVLIIGALGRKVEWLVNFILRAVMGTVGIYFVNYFLESQQLSFAVGINPLTVLTSGFLGFPGVVVLYGIHFFKCCSIFTKMIFLKNTTGQVVRLWV